MRIEATLTRLGRLAVADLARAPSRSNQTVLAFLNDKAEQVFSMSQRWVPVDTGYLKGSGKLVHAVPRDLTAVVRYTADYAAAVHELHRTKGQYLTRAVDRMVENLADDLADSIIADYE